MASKFDTCVYREEIQEYGMRLCTHPSAPANGEARCRGCMHHRTKNQGLKPCPFCGGRATVLNSCHVVCLRCGVGINGRSIDNAIEKWNTRKECK